MPVDDCPDSTARWRSWAGAEGTAENRGSPRRAVLLSRHHAEIVPGFGIVGTQFDGLFEIPARLVEIVSSQVECAEVVIGIGIVGLRRQITWRKVSAAWSQISVLVHCHAKGKVVALEDPAPGSSLERERFVQAIGCSVRNVEDIARQLLRIECALIDLDDRCRRESRRKDAGMGRFLRRSKRCR